MKCWKIAGRLVRPDLNEIVIEGRALHVEPKIMAVLCELSAARNQLVSRERLLERVWSGVFVGDDVLTNAISLLRKALGETAGNATLIQTISRRGYRLTAAIQEVQPSGPTLAVLPFDSQFDPDLGERVAHEIAAELATYPGVCVLFPACQANEIGSPQPADYILHGAVRVHHWTRRITVRLLCPQTGYCVWSGSCEQRTRDAGSSPLVPVIANEVYRHSDQPRTTSDVAIRDGRDVNRLLLRIRHLRQEETVFSLQDAGAMAETLVAIEPSCAAAHAEVAQIRLNQERLALVSHASAEPAVRQAVDSAMRLDPDGSASLICLAQQEFRYDWNWAAAERHFRDAVRANPLDSDPLADLGNLLTLMGRFPESRDCLLRARSRDPLSPAIALQLAYVFHNGGEVERAIPIYADLLRRNPAHLSARAGLVLSFESLRQFTKAARLAWNGWAVSGRGDPRMLAALVRVYALSGQRRKAFRAYDRLRADKQDPYVLACAYSALDDRPGAIRLLKAAAERKNARLTNAAVTPKFAPLRDDTRFRRLLRQIGLDTSN